METDQLKKTNQHLYIVDYDVPREPQSKRRAFYRRLSKLKEKINLFGKMSTKSVVTTTDRALATQIYNLAKTYGGKANFYFGFRKYDDDKTTRATGHTCDGKGM